MGWAVSQAELCLSCPNWLFPEGSGPRGQQSGATAMSSWAWTHRGHHSGRPRRPGSESEGSEIPPQFTKQPKHWDPGYRPAVGRGGEVRGREKGRRGEERDDSRTKATSLLLPLKLGKHLT